MNGPKVLEGNLVDVLEDRIYPARITVKSGKVVSIEETAEQYSDYILPGLIDSHVHIESSLLVPSRFAEAAIPRGVCTVIADPHEIANVMGKKGVEFMIQDAKGAPMKFRFMVPSCVPATAFETSGARLGSKEVESLLHRKEIFGLAEMMNYPGVLAEDYEVMCKIDAAKKVEKPIDGHAPGLSGEALDKYIAAGITTDHECVTEAEAREKADKGMKIQVREGSACSNMKDLIPAVKDREFFLCSDDMHVGQCLNKGYMDRLLRMAVYYGVDPINAVKAATIWPARHYNLDEGSIRVGGPADMVFVSDLLCFTVKRVYIDGELVADMGNALFEVQPMTCGTHIRKCALSAKDLYIPCKVASVKVRAIQVEDKKIASKERIVELKTDNWVVMPDPNKDVLLMAVINRYKEANPVVGFVSGFGFKNGALASSISHDSHNLVAVASSYELLASAINSVSEQGGHYFTDGVKEYYHAAPVAGLMSTETPECASFMEEKVIFSARSCGCKLREPFMTLGFQCLLVVPSLKMSDKGLFDSERFEFTNLLIEE
jgi:adenine deaminase